MSQIRRHLTDMKEECEDMKYIERELATVDRYIPKQNRKYLCYVGHDLHGHFDPNHVDFELLCGTVHTEKAAPAFPWIITIFMLLSIIIIVVLELYYFIPLVLINIPFVILLHIAIKKKCHRSMVPFLIYAVIEKLVWIVTVIFISIVIFNPHWKVYLVLKNICTSSVVDTQMAALLIVLILSITLFITFYLNYNILFHFIYLMHLNTKCCEHTPDCPGRGDIDPIWHGKTHDHSNCEKNCPYKN